MAAFDNSQLRQQTQQLEWLIIWTKIEKTFSTHPPPPEELDRPICFAIDNASYRSVLALEDNIPTSSCTKIWLTKGDQPLSEICLKPELMTLLTNAN